MTHQYSRAERLLTRPFATSTLNPSAAEAPLTNGFGHGHGDISTMANTTANAKGKAKEIPSGMPSTRLPMGPGGMIDVPDDMQESVSRLVDMSVACRYLAAQCQVRQGNWTDATEMLGEANPFRNSGTCPSAVYRCPADEPQAAVDRLYQTSTEVSRSVHLPHSNPIYC